jgi:hypothetical protein
MQVDVIYSKDDAHGDDTPPVPARPPLTASLIRQLAWDVILRRPSTIPPAPELPMAPAPSIEAPATGTGVNVAVLVAMPSPRDLAEFPSSSVVEEEGGEPEEIREYAIGITRTSVQ